MTERVTLYFYITNTGTRDRLIEALNNWTAFAVVAMSATKETVVAKADRAVIEEEQVIQRLAQQYGAVYDGYGGLTRE